MFLYLFYIHRLHSQFFFPLRLIGVSRCPFRCILLNFCKQFEELKQLNISPHSQISILRGFWVRGYNYTPNRCIGHCGASESRYRLFWKPYCQYRGTVRPTPNKHRWKSLCRYRYPFRPTRVPERAWIMYRNRNDKSRCVYPCWVFRSDIHEIGLFWDGLMWGV